MDRMYFTQPEYDTINIGSLVWYCAYNIAIEGPFLVVDIRHAGYGQASHKKWILFDTSKDAHYSVKWDQLRIPKESTCANII